MFLYLDSSLCFNTVEVNPPWVNDAEGRGRRCSLFSAECVFIRLMQGYAFQPFGDVAFSLGHRKF